MVGLEPPTAHLLTLTTHSQVGEVRAALVTRLGLHGRRLAMVEVARGRIVRELDDKLLLRFLNTSARRLYCLEVLEAEEEQELPAMEVQEVQEVHHSSSATSSLSSSRSDLCASSTVSSSTSTGTLTDTSTGTLTDAPTLPSPAEGRAEAQPWKACNICLEDMEDSELVSHIHCTAVLCRECLGRAAAASPGKCPVCLAASAEGEWLQTDLAAGVRPPLRMLTVKVVVTAEQEEGGVARIGHPRLLHLPNTVGLAALSRTLGRIARAQVAGGTPSRLVVVGEEGEQCSRCSSGGERCRGCTLQSLTTEGELQLKPGDSLAIRFPPLEKNVVEEASRVRSDVSMEEARLPDSLHLTDCMEAFSSKEVPPTHHHHTTTKRPHNHTTPPPGA